MSTLTAFIPTHASGLYPTWGIDITVPATYDPETGDMTEDADYLQWIDLGPFDQDDYYAYSPNCTPAARDRLDAAARDAGYWIDWSTYAETAYSEFFAADVYPVEATK